LRIKRGNSFWSKWDHS